MDTGREAVLVAISVGEIKTVQDQAESLQEQSIDLVIKTTDQDGKTLQKCSGILSFYIRFVSSHTLDSNIICELILFNA